MDPPRKRGGADQNRTGGPRIASAGTLPFGYGASGDGVVLARKAGHPIELLRTANLRGHRPPVRWWLLPEVEAWQHHFWRGPVETDRWASACRPLLRSTGRT